MYLAACSVKLFLSFTIFCDCPRPVIEVASGEYGDLNPVLFDAVQGGMCALEEKKLSENNGQSVCATNRPKVHCDYLVILWVF